VKTEDKQKLIEKFHVLEAGIDSAYDVIGRGGEVIIAALDVDDYPACDEAIEAMMCAISDIKHCRKIADGLDVDWSTEL